jgi:hypothetical protein
MSRTGPAFATMRDVATKIDFYRLSRPIQERFAAATRASAPPAPLLYERAPRTRAWGLAAVSLGLVVVEVALLRAGWGDARSWLSLHGVVMMAIDAAVLVAVFYCLLRAAGTVLTLEMRPWRPGTYLFPGCVVDAREPGLRVWPVGEAVNIERVASSPGLALQMRDGSRVLVRAPDAAAAERAEAALEPARRELARASESGDSHALAELDPLHDLAVSSPIGPTSRMTPSVPLWIRLDWVIAIVVGALFGHQLAVTRNRSSDDAMYAAAVGANTVAAYEQYLARGGAHSPGVRDVLLPRAQLHAAEEAGTIEAVRTFADANPSSKIATEIDVALRRATLAELAKAKQAGTVAALDAFAHKYPTQSVASELAAARHALFVKALADWRAKAKPDAGTAAFVERLVAWSEKTGHACEVRFRLNPSGSMEAADKSAMGSRNYPGPDALPSRYVTADALRPREQRVEDAVVQGFAGAFPPDVVNVRGGAPLTGEAAIPHDPPTLVVEYSPEWSRGNTAYGKPLTVFAGLIFNFDASFALPEGAPWRTSVKAWRGAEAWKFKNEQLSREDLEQRVYDAMIDSAFDQLQRRILDVFF